MNRGLAFNTGFNTPYNAFTDRNRERVVVFYGRVSTEHEAQLSALENQMQWYEDQAKFHPNWKVIDKYIDEGITGTQAKKRPSFLSMIEDAKEGKFDLIVTREVCRFARNTVDTLVTTRMLKNLGIEVYFVEDNIWTMDGDGELRLTIMATLAQEESRKVSERVKAGQHISRTNGVIYGNGNILGYDRVGNTYVINEEQAETVRMIFNMYLNDGIGATKIANELSNRRRVAASGKIKWTASNVGRILANPTYMGYMAYGKSFNNNYLEQKRINNHNSETYMLVKGDFEPIVTEEEWYECERIRKSRRAELKIPTTRKTPFGEEKVTKPKQESHDLWNKRLRCSCGYTFRKNRWHKNKTKDWSYGYQCYNQLNNGSAKKRREQGLDTEGFCDMQMIADWKLEVMCKYLLEEIWINRKEAILQAEDFLKNCYQEKKVDKSVPTILIGRIEKTKQKLSNLIDMRTDGDISIEEYRKRKRKLEDELAEYEEQLKNQNTSVFQEKDQGLNWEGIRETLNEVIDFSEPKIDSNVIDKFIARIIPMGNNRFAWFVNVSGASTEEVNMVIDGRKNHASVHIIKENDEETSEDDESSVHSCIDQPKESSFQGKKYSLEWLQHRQLSLVGRTFNLSLKFRINYEQARAFRKANGGYLRGGQWNDLIVEAYII